MLQHPRPFICKLGPVLTPSLELLILKSLYERKMAGGLKRAFFHLSPRHFTGGFVDWAGNLDLNRL